MIKKFNNQYLTVLPAFILAGLLASACQPQNQATPASGVSMTEARAICSTLAVARNTPDFELLDQVMAPDIEIDDPFSNEPMTSLEQAKLFYLGTQSAFPDFSMRHDDIWVDGQTVLARWTISATHTGQWMGIEATGKRVTISGVTVMHVENGKITEQAGYFDLLSIAHQLGATLRLPEDG